MSADVLSDPKKKLSLKRPCNILQLHDDGSVYVASFPQYAPAPPRQFFNNNASKLSKVAPFLAFQNPMRIYKLAHFSCRSFHNCVLFIRFKAILVPIFVNEILGASMVSFIKPYSLNYQMIIHSYLKKTVIFQFGQFGILIHMTCAHFPDWDILSIYLLFDF